MSSSLTRYGTQNWLCIDLMISLTNLGTNGWTELCFSVTTSTHSTKQNGCQLVLPQCATHRLFMPLCQHPEAIYPRVPAPRSLAFTAISNQLQTFLLFVKECPPKVSSSVFSSKPQSARQLRCSEEIWTTITICELNHHPSEVYFEEGLVISLSSFQDVGLPACCWKILIL